MSLFDTLAGVAKGASNAVHGTAVRIVPTIAPTSPNAKGRLLDPERPAFDTTVRFYRFTEGVGDDEARRGILRSGSSDRAMHARSDLTATIDDPEHRLRADDMLRRDSDGAIFQITDVNPDGTGSFVLFLATAAELPTG